MSKHTCTTEESKVQRRLRILLSQFFANDKFHQSPSLGSLHVLQGNLLTHAGKESFITLSLMAY